MQFSRLIGQFSCFLKQQLIEAKLAGNTQKVGELVLALDKLKQEKEAQEFLLDQEEEKEVEEEQNGSND